MNTTVIHGAKAEPHGSLPLTLSGRIPELDGLRGIAIGIVVIFHYFQLTHASRHGSLLSYLQSPARLGWTGVDLFFVLSGFLIGGILLDARTSANYRSTYKFADAEIKELPSSEARLVCP
jgi:peptidoglycan/LPS O-acetylase OafA/YrhL